MKYMGSKNRIAKYILPIMLKDRREGQYWVEPFVGGANMIDKVCGNRIGADFNVYVILALQLIRDNLDLIPEVITEEMYKDMQKNKALDKLTSFTAFAMSFGGKFFGGYRRDVAGSTGCIENMKTQTRRSKQNAVQQNLKIQNVKLIHSSYQDLDIPDNSIIYCDPPYENTTSYKDKFNHEEFWEWCRIMSSQGHRVYVSEYNAPDDFECIWHKEINVSLTKDTGSKKGIERLFTLKE